MPIKAKLYNVKTIILIIVLTIAVSACSLNNKKTTVRKDNLQATADELKAANSEATANQFNIKPVRAIDATDHVLGTIQAPVQLIIFSDFECPFSAQFKNTMQKIRENYQDKVAIAFRHNPLRTHPLALPAAEAAECAAEQDKFWEMHDKLFAANISNELGPEMMTSAAKELGLDIIKFAQCLETEKYKTKIQTQLLEAINSGVTGTPGIFVNAQPLAGAVPFEDYTGSDGNKYEGMKNIIQKQLDKI